MGFWSLLVVAFMPVLELLLIGLIGAFLASGYSNILTSSALRDINKIVFFVFTPALVFGSLAKTITLEDIISWWFMPINIGLTFIIGGLFGWMAVKILKPEAHLEGLIIANSSAGNLGFLLLMVIPAVCNENGSPFGDAAICTDHGLSYNSLSMAIGLTFIWTHIYSLMKNSGTLQEKRRKEDGISNIANGESDSVAEAYLPEDYTNQEAEPLLAIMSQLSSRSVTDKKVQYWHKAGGTLHLIAVQLMAPPNIAAILGFAVGVTPLLKSLIIGGLAPLRVIEDSVTMLGDGTIPCSILVLGGNLIQGLRKPTLRPRAIVAIILVKYLLLPVSGIFVVKTASRLGFLAQDPLYQYVLLIQYALPPATAIGTMAQLFDVGQEECSVIFLWTYVVAAVALTFWSTIFMSILS